MVKKCLSWKKWKRNGDSCNESNCKCPCGVYCLGFIGAAVYYIQQATGFWSGVVGILKAIVWPAFVIYKLLGYL